MRAQVQWRHGDEVGVAFAGGAKAPGSPRSLDVGELAERVGKLEAELASMRKMLKRLKAEVAGKDDEAA